MSIIQKDITLLTSITELPDTFDKQGDFLRVKTDGSGDPEWFDTNTGSVSIETGLFGNGSVSQPSITFQSDTNTGIYRLGEDDVGITTGGVTRLAVNGTSVEVGTLSNNLNFNVNGNSSATRFRAGDGAQGTPSFSFSNTNGTDTGMYYNGGGGDKLVFSVNNFMNLQMRDNDTTTLYRTLEINRTGGSTASTPSLNLTDATTGLFRPTTNQVAITNNGVQNTNFTTTGVDIGLTNANNTNLKTLTQNGASNFNTFTPSYSSFLLPQTAIGTIGQALSGVDFDGTNYVVSIVGTAAGNRLWVSQNLSTWTAINDTQIALGNSQVQYGNGIWCYLSRVASQTRQLWTSTAPATTWTQIGAVAPWTSNGTAQRLKFINGQFIVLFSSSVLRYSSDGLNWTSYSVNATAYNLNDITYSPELQRYVIVTSSTVVLYFNGNTITNTSAFTAVTGLEQANCCSYSPKYGLFLYHGNTNNQRYYISKDGINWTYYTNPTTVTNSNNTIWINDFGGFFLDMQFSQSQVAVSRDGLSFQTIASNLTMTTVNAVYNSTGKVLLIVGSSGSWGTFRNLLTDFNNYIDRDNIYNTFNSNIRFADNIEYQIQEIQTATGNNHYTPFSFNRSVINFDTTTTNANIYLSGSSFNGKVGSKFTIRKTLTSTNAVRIHGYETCNFVSPLGNVIGFNSQSSPQVYNFIPANYFGSFDLTRIDDVNGGTWLIDNLNVFDNSGNNLNIGNLSLNGYLQCNPSSQSATNPAIYFSTNTNSGIYTGGTNLVNISSAGIQKMEIGSGLTIGTNTNLCDTTIRGNLIVTNNSYGQLFRFTSPRTTKTSSWTLSSNDSRIIEVDNSATCDLTLADLAEGSDYIIHKKGLGTFRIVVPSGFQCNNLTAGTYTIFLGAIQGHIRLTQITSTPTSPVEFIYDNTAH